MMDIFELLSKKTCFFKIKTNIENQYLVQEFGSGADGHLMRYPLQSPETDVYYQFLLYPDTKHSKQYRMMVVGWPDYQVELESNRAKIKKKSTSQQQLFTLKKTSPPATESDGKDDWYYLKGVGVDQLVGFASHGYVYPYEDSNDQHKLKFEPMAVVEPKALPELPEARQVSWPQPPENGQAVSGDEYGHVTISTEAIPAALVEDDEYLNKIDQVKLNPYYYLQWERLWTRRGFDSFSLSDKKKITKEVKYKYSFSSSDFSSFEKTIGKTFDVSLEAYAERKNSSKISLGDGDSSASGEDTRTIGGKVKLAFQYQEQTKTLKQNNQSKSQDLEITNKVEYRQLEDHNNPVEVYLWAPVDRYTLSNGQGKVLKSWDYVVPNKLVDQEVERAS
jgi:hypothetical protein